MASKTTTYVVRIDNADGFDARATDTMPYTHAVVAGEPGREVAWSWHTTRENARKKAADVGGRIVEAEAINGSKVSVVKRLRAELAEAAELEKAGRTLSTGDELKAPKTRRRKPTAKELELSTEAPAKSTATPADEVRAMAGYRVHTKSRSTKTTAVLVDGEAAELDTDGGRWQLICLDHNFIVADSSQRHARDVLAHPEEWCGPCGKAFRKAAKTA